MRHWNLQEGQILVDGTDISTVDLGSLRRNFGVVLQDPINMGYLGVKTLVDHLQGKKVEKEIDTGSEVATPENMNDPKMKNLLEPDFKKWLNE